MGDWFFPRGALARDGWDVVVDDTLPGWRHTGLRVGSGERELQAGDLERVIVPLEGDVVVRHDGVETVLAGRPSVFAGPADALYLGVGAAATLCAAGRVAVVEAPVLGASAAGALPAQVIRAADVPIEHRGGGAASRVVRNLGLPGALDAQKLLVCEVVTPAGNWSGVPPHKHDETIEGRESKLEEIYWFDVAVAANQGEAASSSAAAPIGVFAAYGSPAGAIDMVELVRPGDVALVPYGYHGPAGAMPGYDLYYLNVMAGPDAGRAWRITDDPAHAWIRRTWSS